METWVVVLIVIAVIALIIWGVISMVHVLQEYERGVVFRLGRVRGRPKGPGLIILLPFGIDRMRKVTIQTVAMNVPPQDVITKDNVTMRVDAVIYAKVVDPVPAVVRVQNYLFAVSQTAQTNLRASLGKYDLETLLSEREAINRELHGIIARVTHDWGVEVLSVEVKDVDLPDDLRRAMAREAEAGREAKALLISADAELRASRVLAEAAVILSKNPQAMQIRFLQTVTAVATEQNSTLVMPIPIELLGMFGGRGDQGNGLPAAPPAVSPAPPSQSPPGPEEGRQPGPGNGRPG
ncbi:MAG TPA: slipin family protein [Actinomycetes bacterium]|jgi:regulator of protease activity HflC (stomatin/prohibitin superfamily)|nr:slipin family protein [Actinomycetes bacterium]HET9289870.1 slipin family protein [Actinomycetes bacterium]HEX5882686.1 slipin family protein [Actinomycetota bacterium]